MYGIQPLHIVIIIIVGLIVFGPRRLPEIARSLAKGINEFRREAGEMTHVLYNEINAPLDGQALSSVADRGTLPEEGPSAPLAAVGAVPPGAMEGGLEPSYINASGGDKNPCPQCGLINMREAKFCNQCGARLPIFPA
jgi:sec-independent protein translocase protein TatA